MGAIEHHLESLFQQMSATAKAVSHLGSSKAPSVFKVDDLDVEYERAAGKGSCFLVLGVGGEHL
jgi:hypothetical protein